MKMEKTEQLYTVYEKLVARGTTKEPEYFILLAHHTIETGATTLFTAVALPLAAELLKRYIEARAAGETPLGAIYLATKKK